jgi:hypothetical protein
MALNASAETRTMDRRARVAIQVRVTLILTMVLFLTVCGEMDQATELWCRVEEKELAGVWWITVFEPSESRRAENSASHQA